MINPDRLKEIEARYEEVQAEMAQPDVATDIKKMALLGREHRSLMPVVAVVRNYVGLRDEIDALKDMIAADEDAELTAMARLELEVAIDKFKLAEEELEVALIPKAPEDSKDAIVEIRAGTGGDEASIFAGDLYRMYQRFAEKMGWQTELIDLTHGTVGGFKEIVFSLKGTDAYGNMRYESGVHRVQRVPATESQGRVHTSAATVAVMPEAEEVDVQINEKDLRIDTFCSSGAGGQSVNTTYSAVRITHLPTGVVVSCQDERSQLKNREKAMRVLRARLYEFELERQAAEQAQTRKGLVGSGDRSAKIRTYNYPQGRLTDHRLEGEFKNHALQNVIDGELEKVIKALRMADHAEKMAGI